MNMEILPLNSKRQLLINRGGHCLKSPIHVIFVIFLLVTTHFYFLYTLLQCTNYDKIKLFFLMNLSLLVVMLLLKFAGGLLKRKSKNAGPTTLVLVNQPSEFNKLLVLIHRSLMQVYRDWVS